MTTDDLAQTLRAILQRHLGRTCTAAVLRVEDASGVVLELPAGRSDPGEDDSPTETSTPFDLASLTKLFTASAILWLVGAGRLELDGRLSTYLPQFDGPGKERVTLRQLLTHTSGLPPLVRLFGSEIESGDPWSLIFGCELENEPGAAVVYSDVGFMLLGRLIEVATGAELRQAMQRLVLDPLVLPGMQYGPCPSAPATEYDTWRGRRIRGEVHDENAAVLGGAAGHAGLFGPAADVSRLARAYWAPDGRFVPAELAREAIVEQAASGYERRGLGWKLASRSPDAADSVFSPETFGHYGFTGTAVWTDPVKGCTVVLLTNRVYYGRDAAGIAALRREVFSAVAAASGQRA